jgi:hypothetical protein
VLVGFLFWTLATSIVLVRRVEDRAPAASATPQ